MFIVTRRYNEIKNTYLAISGRTRTHTLTADSSVIFPTLTNAFKITTEPRASRDELQLAALAVFKKQLLSFYWSTSLEDGYKPEEVLLASVKA